MDVFPTDIPGCLRLRAGVFTDQRGAFVKFFHAPTFEHLGLPTDFREDFFSVSGVNVIRGMHFQLPPWDHGKLVSVLRGKVYDVVLDLRRGSPTFGKHVSTILEADRGDALFIPSGLAHGFCSLEEGTLLGYKTTREHHPEHDAGVRFDSFGETWPTMDPVISSRDLAHPEFKAFNSPFFYEEPV
ncbi:MAG: dTDP-4-dehydrorhamnose 3,5-epimerase family protein [Lentisphaeria bacterium]|nr:dTDP-4-dehydrorhamnose 3,5-epimerase family protein [Lentisphaeria bacterium]